MKLKNKKSIWTLVSSLVMVLPFFLGFGGMPEALAAEPEKTTQTVTLHKLQFESMPSDQQNTGDENMVYSNSKPLAGAIFTAYDMTAVYWEEYENFKGDDKEKTDAAQKAVLALKDTDLGAGLPFPVTDENGEAPLDLPKKSNNRNAIYLIKETTSPAGVVQSKSAPFVLGLPVYNEENYSGDNGKANEEKAVVHVYPKNEVKPVELAFTKYGVDVDENGTATPTPLKDAEFVLKDTKSGKFYVEGDATTIGDTSLSIFSGEKITDGTKILSDENGKVSLVGLLLPAGTYEFYEVDSDVSTSQEQKTDTEDEIFHYGKSPMVTATIDKDMNVKYTYYDVDGNKLTKQTEKISAYNYKVPTPTKKVDDHSVDGDQAFTFTITQLIPKDIEDYKKFALVDNFDPALYLVHTADTDPTLENEVMNSFKLDGVNTNGLVSGVSIDSDTEFTVNFDLDEVKKHPGETLSFEVTMAVKPNATIGTDINNEVTFDNNFHDESAKDAVQTSGKKFIKKDADSNKALADAVFHVLNTDGKILGTKDGKQVWGTEGEKGFTAKELKSDKNGQFSVAGLAKFADDGKTLIEYQLKEITAPSGYVLANGTLKFEADDQVTELTVPNKHKGSLPSTGGTGIIAFVAIGVVAVAGAVLYFTKGRRQIEG